MYIHMVIAQGLDAHVMRDIFLPKLTNMGPGAVSALWIFFEDGEEPTDRQTES